MMKLGLLIIIACAVSNLVFAQDFAIKRVELANDVVNIYYDLLDTAKDKTYTIDMYSSKDNFITRLAKTSGDIGLEVKPGKDRKITWNAKQELGADFQGKVGLEVRGRVYIPFVRLDGLNKMYKRGKEYQLNWRGGTQQNILNFDLYQGDEVKHSISNIANVGQTTIVIPTSVKPGKDYYFKITDSKNKDQIVNTAHFTVKRKIPLLLKALPILIVGGAVATLGGGGSKSNTPTTPATIPDPLSPTTIH